MIIKQGFEKLIISSTSRLNTFNFRERQHKPIVRGVLHPFLRRDNFNTSVTDPLTTLGIVSN